MFCAVECIIALFAPRLFFRLFVNDPAVVEFGVVYMRICIIKFLLQIFQGSYQAMVTGSGFASLGLFVGIFDGVILRIGFSLLFANVLGLGVEGYFYGDALAHLGAVIPCMIYFYSGKWKTRKLLTGGNVRSKN